MSPDPLPSPDEQYETNAVYRENCLGTYFIGRSSKKEKQKVGGYEPDMNWLKVPFFVGMLDAAKRGDVETVR